MKRYGTPGPRVLSPDACTSEKLASTPLEAQLLWDRLVVQADDQGRFLASPLAVRAACFPLVDVSVDDVGGWLQALADVGLLLLYTGRQADGSAPAPRPQGAGSVRAPCGQIIGWWDYQAGMRRAYPSRYEAPEGWEDQIYGIPKDKRPGSAGCGQSAGRVRKPGARLPAPAVAFACVAASGGPPGSQPLDSDREHERVEQPSAPALGGLAPGSAQEGLQDPAQRADDLVNAITPDTPPASRSRPPGPPPDAWGPCPACGAASGQWVTASVRKETCPEHGSMLRHIVQVACPCGADREHIQTDKPCLRCAAEGTAPDTGESTHAA